MQKYFLQTSHRLPVLLIALAAALVIPFISLPEIARADINNTRADAFGTDELAGASWLDGAGVVIKSNGSSAGDHSPITNNSVNGINSGEEWQCVEMVNRLYLTQGWTTANWSGDGNTLINNVPSGLTAQTDGSISYLHPGDVLTLDGGPAGTGHAGIINSVGSTIQIVNQNTVAVYSSASLQSGTSFGAGNADIDMSGWATYTVQTVVHAPQVRLGALTTTPSYLAKQNSYDNNPWVTINNDSTVTQGIQSGSLTAVVNNGALWVKQGSLSSSWVTEMNSGVAKAAIFDNYGTNTMRIGYLSTSGSFFVKEGISGTWTDEYDGVSAGYLAGSRIGVLTSSGAFLVKDGTLGASWTTLYTSGVSQGVVSSNLVGMMLSGSFYVKQGSLSNPWTDEYDGAVTGQLSDLGYITPIRIGVIDNLGNLYVKEGSLTATWTTIYNGVVSQAVLSGNLIGVQTGGTYLVKQGSLGASWVTENTGINNITLWTPN